MNNRDILGVSQNASNSEIKHAFRNAAKELHPDISGSPEAAAAFQRIKEAHDALLQEAEAPRESTTVANSAARAAAATARAPYTTQSTHVSNDDLQQVQDLDETVRAKPKRSLFGKVKEPEEVKRHRKKIDTANRRLRGLY